MNRDDILKRLKEVLHQQDVYNFLSLDGVTLNVHDGDKANFFSFFTCSMTVSSARISYGRYTWYGTSSVLYRDIDSINAITGTLYLNLKSGSYITVSLYDESKRSGWEEKSC